MVSKTPEGEKVRRHGGVANKVIALVNQSRSRALEIATQEMKRPRFNIVALMERAYLAGYEDALEEQPAKSSE